MKYTIEWRKEGNRTVFDVYDEKGRKLWAGLSLAGLNDIFEMVVEANE